MFSHNLFRVFVVKSEDFAADCADTDIAVIEVK